mgnify:CR=1 FL=1
MTLIATHEDAKALGYSLMALIYISMDMHTPERFENFEQQIRQVSEVLECLLITGQDADYQLKVVVRDMDAFQELLLNRINRRRLLARNTDLTTSIRMDDYRIGPVGEGCFDLFYIARK